MPKQNSKHYRGISNQWGDKSSAKLDLITDLLSGDILDLEISDGTKQDRVSGEDILAHIQPKDLVLRDMGYFSTDVFKKIEAAGAYLISRLPANTGVSVPQEKVSSLEAYLKAQPSSINTVDIMVDLTLGKKHPTRLVAMRCSQEITNQRRAHLKAHRKKMKSQPNQLSLEREGWTIYVTNLPKEHYTAEQIHQIYGFRWNIEIEFRALKGQSHIRSVLDRIGKKKHHLEILMHAIMIYAQLRSKTFAALKKAHPKWKMRLSTELVANWFNTEIQKVCCLFSSLIFYDLRHLSSDKRPSRTSQQQLINSLF